MNLKNITLLQHLEVPPRSPVLPPQTTPWHQHQHQHALSSSSCLPASPSNFNRLQQLSGHRPLLSLRDAQKLWQRGPKIQTAPNNNTNWPHRDHKLSSETHRSELIRSEPRDLVEKKRSHDVMIVDNIATAQIQNLHPKSCPGFVLSKFSNLFVKICFLPALYSDCNVMDFHIYNHTTQVSIPSGLFQSRHFDRVWNNVEA